MSNASLDRGIQAIIPAYQPASDETLAQYAVDGIIPQAVVSPENVEQVSEIIRLAGRMGLSVIPRGSGTKMGLGLPPSRADIVLSLDRLNKVLEYEPADLTATVQAGIRLTDLQTQLGEHGQFFPIDPPYGDACTLGGVIATNASGLLRWTHGTARDLVIGTKVVQADGTVVKAGGKVVKNVAGYDMNKMYIGSLGTLGIIVELTLKLQPRPEAGRAVLARFPFITTAVDTAFKGLDSPIAPSFVEMANPVPVAILARRAGGGLGDAGFPLIIGAIGPSETVNWQIAEAEKLCHQAGAVQVVTMSPQLYRTAIDLIREFPTGQIVPQGMRAPGVVCRASVLPSDVGRLYQIAEDRSQKLGVGCAMLSHFGNGAVVFVFFQDQPFEGERLEILVSIIRQLSAAATEFGGHLTVESAPLAVKQRLDVWGARPSDWGLMRALKDRFDPSRVLSPGRFVGGL
ncbi:MAG: FAD-binding oxidoreductase [Candidatus Latescibacteria bacterium]|nr:FAD-binding oxidoreductase [Candidatus Latescibacterota bacterium]